MNRNADVKQEIITSQRLQLELGDNVQQPVPVIEVNPKIIAEVKVANANVFNGTTGTILSADTNNDIYIIGCESSLIKDVTSTSGTSYISVTLGGKVTRIIEIVGLTLTVQQQNVVCMFSHPLKIDQNTAIYLNNQTGVANINTTGIIYYYKQLKN